MSPLAHSLGRARPSQSHTIKPDIVASLPLPPHPHAHPDYIASTLGSSPRATNRDNTRMHRASMYHKDRLEKRRSSGTHSIMECGLSVRACARAIRHRAAGPARAWGIVRAHAHPGSGSSSGPTMPAGYMGQVRCSRYNALLLRLLSLSSAFVVDGPPGIIGARDRGRGSSSSRESADQRDIRSK